MTPLSNISAMGARLGLIFALLLARAVGQPRHSRAPARGVGQPRQPRAPAGAGSSGDEAGPPFTRFLLVSQPRSGSTWVLSKIATHACVVSRSESGHAMWGSSGGGGGSCKQAACFEGYFRALPGGGLAARARDAHAAGCPSDARLVVGGKVWGTQMLTKADKKLAPHILAYLRAQRVRVILVSRLNALDQHISQANIVATGTGNGRMHCHANTTFHLSAVAARATRGERVDPRRAAAARAASKQNPCYDDPDVRVTVQVDKVIELARAKARAFDNLAEQWGLGAGADARVGGIRLGAGFPVLYLPYETLRANRTLWDEAAALLALRPGAPGGDVFAADRTVKRVRRTHREIIANYAEVETRLRQADLAWLLEDVAD